MIGCIFKTVFCCHILHLVWLTVVAGSVGIVTVDTDGYICSFTPYFELWKLHLLDIKRSKVHIIHYVLKKCYGGFVYNAS